MPYRILLADDHTLVREGLKQILSATPELEVVAEAMDGGLLAAQQPLGVVRVRVERGAETAVA